MADKGSANADAGGTIQQATLAFLSNSTEVEVDAVKKGTQTACKNDIYDRLDFFRVLYTNKLFKKTNFLTS